MTKSGWKVLADIPSFLARNLGYGSVDKQIKTWGMKKLSITVYIVIDDIKNSHLYVGASMWRVCIYACVYVCVNMRFD